jgi:uncharacterized protein (TIGR02145 family)
MKTSKNLAKFMLISMLTAGIGSSFTACTECDDIEKMSSNTNDSQLMNLEQHSYTVPVQVNVEGDWEIELKFNNPDNEFCYVYPEKGHGPATVKLCVLDNWTNQRNSGKMIIKDLRNPIKNQTLKLGQKCNLDGAVRITRGDDNQPTPESQAQVGDRLYGVGYGYNVAKAPGNTAISRNPLIALEKAKAEGCKVTVSPVDAQIKAEQYGAQTISGLTRNMETSANLKGSYGGFTAEANSTYSKSQVETTTNMFGFGVIDVKVLNSQLEKNDMNNVRNFLTPAAKKALDGSGSAYPSTAEGFKKLINDYGSHLILKTSLGGRLRYGTTCDKQVCKTEDEIKAMASCSYKNKIAEAAFKVTASQKKTFESNKSKIQTSISAVGGSFETVAALYGQGNDTDTNVNAWIQSLKNNDNLAVVGFNDKSANEMIPLWQLIDPSKKDRVQGLKEYLENGQMQQDFYDGKAIYDTGDLYKITIPSMDEMMNKYGHATKNSDNGTLVYEVWDKSNDHMVALLCSEYIPEITTRHMVQVLYTVENNRPDLNTGFFLGDEDHQACTITWNGNNKVEFTNNAGKNGKEGTIYLRAGVFSTPDLNKISMSKSNINNCNFRGQFLADKKCKSDVSVVFGYGVKDKGLVIKEFRWTDDWKNVKYEDYKYPLVMIGTKIWTRENYNGNIDAGKDNERWGTKVDEGNVYYTRGSIASTKFPAGWHAASSSDYQYLKDYVNKQVPSGGIIEVLQKGGASGFDNTWDGCYTYEKHEAGLKDRSYFYFNYQHKEVGDHVMYYITGNKDYMQLTDKGMNIKNDVGNRAMRARLVKD